MGPAALQMTEDPVRYVSQAFPRAGSNSGTKNCGRRVHRRQGTGLKRRSDPAD